MAKVIMVTEDELNRMRDELLVQLERDARRDAERPTIDQLVVTFRSVNYHVHRFVDGVKNSRV